MKGKGSIEIAASPKKVWLFVVEPENMLKWHPFMKRMDFVGEQRSGVGAMFYTEGKMDDRVMRSLNVVNEWQENKKLAFGVVLADMIKKWDAVWTIEPTETGSRLTIAYDGELPYWILGKIMALFARKQYSKATQEMLASLKRLAESQTD